MSDSDSDRQWNDSEISDSEMALCPGDESSTGTSSVLTTCFVFPVPTFL